MKKLFAVAFLGLATLGHSAEPAAAGWFHRHSCSCDVVIRCRQYNAFSPPCCGENGLNGHGPAPGPGGACYGAPGFEGHTAQFGPWTGGALAGQPMQLPGQSTPIGNPPLANSLRTAPAPVPGITQQLPSGWMRPNGPWLYHPTVNPGYAPPQGIPSMPPAQ